MIHLMNLHLFCIESSYQYGDVMVYSWNYLDRIGYTEVS